MTIACYGLEEAINDVLETKRAYERKHGQEVSDSIVLAAVLERLVDAFDFGLGPEDVNQCIPATLVRLAEGLERLAGAGSSDASDAAGPAPASSLEALRRDAVLAPDWARRSPAASSSEDEP